MKRYLCMILSIIMLLAVMSISQGSALATEAPNALGESESGKYMFSYKVAHREKYQLNQEQLNAPTDELIDDILEYPYLIDLFSSSSISKNAYAILRSSFNGLEELEKRADAATVMLSKYADAIDTREGDASLTTLYLRTLLSEPTYAQKFSDSEKELYMQMCEVG